MNKIFLEILNNSIMTSYLIIAVIILRVILKRAPKWSVCLLWGMIAIRLVVPFEIESRFSLLPNLNLFQVEENHNILPIMESGQKDGIRDQYFRYKQNSQATNNNSQISHANKEISEYFGEEGKNSVLSYRIAFNNKDFLYKFINVISYVWLIGSFGLLSYVTLSFLKLKQKVSASIRLYDNLYLCDEIESPFVMGIFKPRIYLSSQIPEEVWESILKHEEAHIKRADHIWKLLGYVLLAIYWFNPLSWAAYILFCKDIELACDEKVTKDMNKDQRMDYCEALLVSSINQKKIDVYPVAFGEVGVKERIKQILNYKKPSFWMILLAVITCTVVAVCFMTNPKSKKENEDVEMTVQSSFDEQREKEEEERNSDSWAGEVKFTMEDLIVLCDEGSEALKNALTDFSEEGELPYNNFEKEVAEFDWSYFCYLTYGEREYRLQASYELSDQYGFKMNELNLVNLYCPETGEYQRLYVNEERFASPPRYSLDIRDFLEKK